MDGLILKTLNFWEQFSIKNQNHDFEDLFRMFYFLESSTEESFSSALNDAFEMQYDFAARTHKIARW